MSDSVGDQTARFSATLCRLDRSLFSSDAVAGDLRAFDAMDSPGRYGAMPASVIEKVELIERRHSADIVSQYYRLLLAALIDGFEMRLAARRIPPSIISLFRVSFERILAEMELNSPEFYRSSNDLFLKDLAICRMKLYPCGSELLDEFSGISRRILVSGGISQFLRCCVYFGRHPSVPYYEMHMDPRHLQDFNPEGWDACYARIAELLLLNPHINGMFAASWWYDPEISRISPRLAYLRERRQNNGALVLRAGSDANAIANATKTSATRRSLYERGAYLPTNFLAVWHRDDIIRWAETRKVRVA